MPIGIRSAVRWAANGKAFAAFVSALERIESKPNLLRVLTYHRVDELESRGNLAPVTLSATPDRFSQQMEFLAENYSVLSMEELIAARQHGTRLPARAVLVTFDDAYCDFAQHAWPILQRYDLPATLFVPTAYPDHPERQFWWDRLYHSIMEATPATYQMKPWGSFTLGTRSQREVANRQLTQYTAQLEDNAACDLVDEVCDLLASPKQTGVVLGWNELRSLAGPRLTLAPHTRTHPLLNRIGQREARDEILGSLEDLQREIGETPRVFAYPGGALTSDVVEILREEGFEIAFTTRRGINHWDHCDPLRLDRINVGYRCPLGLWRGQLLGMARHLMRN